MVSLRSDEAGFDKVGDKVIDKVIGWMGIALVWGCACGSSLAGETNQLATLDEVDS